MSSSAALSLDPGQKLNSLLPWLLLLLGLLAMYVPTGWDLFSGYWSSESQGHGPIVLGISLWLIYRKWPVLFEGTQLQTNSRLNWALFAFSMLLYVVGRSQSIMVFELGSFIFTLFSLALLLGGRVAMKRLLFPFFFMLFMLPLPGAFVDALTLPMKIAVSHVAEEVLFTFGYPIARSGVVLQIGQYKLLVADACAGLHTLFTLEALGLLYLNLVRHPSAFRNVMLALLIVPISFTANSIRVIVLTLITYHFGDEAGQGFLHGFAGMVLFISALMLIIGLDSLLRLRDKGRVGQEAAVAKPASVVVEGKTS